MRQTFLIFLFVSFALGCSVTEKSQRRLNYSVMAGLNKGGITENTDLKGLSDLPGASNDGIDAFTGATRMGGHAGIRLNQPLRYGALETGMEYMFNPQTFYYADPVHGHVGQRKLDLHQLMFPLTYNFLLLKRRFPRAEFTFRLGYLGQINFLAVNDMGLLPDYTFNSWSNGGTTGFSAYLIQFENKGKLGLYVDGYRGSRIYTDFYNPRGAEVPGSSFVKFGVRYQFR